MRTPAIRPRPGAKAREATRWRGAPNSAPRRAHRRSALERDAQIGGTIRWIDRERGLVYLRIEQATARLNHWVGHLIGADVTGARTRYDIADRNRDRRIGLGDVALGDWVDVAAASVPEAPTKTLRATRVRVQSAG